MNNEIFAGQGLIVSIMGGGQIVAYYFIASALSNMFPAWHTIIWAVAGLLGLEALIMLGAGLLLLYAGVKA